ncbi:MAG: thioredoxin-disulfide reductase [Candidatus Omnitrophica bacterium]|jgi:thioredoxin reductase (NADPH)|nr:thioredoxin-disulfide reductase [Candidatus Omnitrophota bacterium]
MHDLIIIGAGPAGLTAALYAGRFRLNTVVLEKINIGGQIVTSPTIDNFPGFPGGIATHELIEKMKHQVDDLGVVVMMEEAQEIIPHVDAFGLNSYKIKVCDKFIETKAIIIATGAQPKKLGVEGENRLIGRGVSYCGTCDAPLFRNKEVVVVGGGDRAVEEAIFLTSYAKKVTIVHRRQEFRASKILEEKIKANHKINFILESVVEEITGQNRVEAIKIKNVKNNQLSNFACDGVFIFVGIRPNTEFIKNLLNTTEAGFIITQPDLRTSKAGIFACGDCLEKNLYQVVSACGEGATAADSAYKYLLMLKG